MYMNFASFIYSPLHKNHVNLPFFFLIQMQEKL